LRFKAWSPFQLSLPHLSRFRFSLDPVTFGVLEGRAFSCPSSFFCRLSYSSLSPQGSSPFFLLKNRFTFRCADPPQAGLIFVFSCSLRGELTLFFEFFFFLAVLLSRFDHRTIFP